MLLRATRFGDLRCRTLSWCRRTRISASNAARDRSSPIKAHQINLQTSLIDGTINRFGRASQLFWVCGRDSGAFMPGQIMQGVAEDARANDWRPSGKLAISFDQGLPCLLLPLR